MLLELGEVNRKSLLTHLAKGDYYRAEMKIEDNLSQININLNDLERYCNKIVSKKDKKDFILKGNKLLEDTAKMFEQTLLLIKDFRQHKFLNRKDKIRYLTLLETYENRTNKAKTKLSDISDRLNLQNLNVIEYERQSILESRRGTSNIGSTVDSKDVQIFKSKLDEKLLVYEYKDDLDMGLIEERGKQVQLIVKIMDDIQKLSQDCFNIAVKSGQHVDSISDHIDKANQHTQNGLKEIKEADQLQQARTSNNFFFSLNKVILFLFIFVFILFFATLSK